MPKDKVLITGANGQLGQELVKIFQKDWVVIPTDKEDMDFSNPEQTNQARRR